MKNLKHGVMKTALQEAFSLLEELHPNLFDIHTEKGRTFVNTFHKFLDLEKEQIIKSHKDAYLICGFEHSAEDCSNEYYFETYENQRSNTND